VTPAQKARLLELLPGMRQNARRAVSQNDYHKAWNEIENLEHFLALDEMSIREMGVDTATVWIAIAEKAAAGSDTPGTIKGMSMDQIRSGMPPEHKGENV
jgi:hypothetical protein